MLIATWDFKPLHNAMFLLGLLLEISSASI